MSEPKYLIKRNSITGIGNIFLTTPQLLTKPDLHPYYGEVPKSMVVKLGEMAFSGPILDKRTMPTDAKGFTNSKAFAPETSTTGTESQSTATLSPEDTGSTLGLDSLPPAAPPVAALSSEEKHAKLVSILKDEKTFPKDDEHYTPKGTPKLEAVIFALGQDVQTHELNAAVAAVSSAPVKIELTAGQRQDAAMQAMTKLKKSDMTANKRNPLPNIDAMKRLTGIDDYNGVEREQDFETFKEQNPNWKPLEG